jgi:hypothetical protein
MFIELNRFLTADEVRTLYQFPEELFAKLLPRLPVAYRDAAGVTYYLESVVDKVLHEWAGASVKTDGPVPPDKLRIGPDEYDGFTRLEWRLLEFLWGKPAVLFQDVMDHIYGENHYQTDEALEGVIKRLNIKLTDKRAPVLIDPKNGYIRIKKVRLL